MNDPEKNIDYYLLRLNEIMDLFKAHKTELLDENQDKIKNLIKEYQTNFNDHPKYQNPVVIKTFILN